MFSFGMDFELSATSLVRVLQERLGQHCRDKHLFNILQNITLYPILYILLQTLILNRQIGL